MSFNGNSLTTWSHKLYVARQEAAANTTFSDNLATAGDFANRPTDIIDLLDIPRLDPNIADNPKVIAEIIVNGMVFYFGGGDTNNDAFTWTIFAWRNENGPAEIVADGTGILGSQAIVKYPHNGITATSKFWADTLAVSNDRWLKEVEATSVGGDSVSKVWLDAAGYRYWYVEIPTSVGDMASWFGYF